MKTLNINSIFIFQPFSFLFTKEPRFKTKVTLRGNKKVLIKEIVNKSNVLLPYLLENEVNLLKVLNKYSKENLRFAKVYEFVKSNAKTYYVREYLEGRISKNFSEDKQLKFVDECLKSLKSISSKMSAKDLEMLPKRKALSQLLTFQIYLLIAVLKDPNNYKECLTLASIFYKNVNLKYILKPKYSIAHRDLTSENLIIRGNKIQPIDLEVMAYAEINTDLALVPRYYYRDVKIEKIVELLKKNLKTKSDKQNFARLTAFYNIQFLAISADKKYLAEAKEYVKPLCKKIMPALSL